MSIEPVIVDRNVGHSHTRTRAERADMMIDGLRRLGVPARLGSLESGDVAFTGLGPDGPVPVGIELKTVVGLLSDMVSGRFAGHQVPAMQAAYPYRYVFVEGAVRANLTDGVLEIPMGEGRWQSATPRMMYVDYLKFLQDIDLRGGFHMRRTWSKIDTIAHIAAEYHGWRKEWDKHKALKAFNNAPQSGVVMMHPPTLLRLWARDLPGVGWVRSEDVERRFANPLAMAKATEAEWRSVPGIGKTIAARVWAAIRGIDE